MPPNSRLISLSVLNEVDQDKQTLDHLLDATFTRIGNLPQREKNLTFTIVYGVLRHRKRLDWILGHFSRTGLDKLDPEVLNILRIGLFQMVYLTRIPASAAVNTAVDLAKTLKKPWLAKFVNAVLRAAAREYPELSPPDMENDPVSAVSIEKSMPEWLISRWIPRFGVSQTLLLCDIINTIPPLTLRVNTLKTTRSALLESGNIHARCMEPTAYGPDGIRLDHPEDPVASMAGFREGFFQVQDEAAQLVTLLLDPRPGETVMDACAGMGGKTGHIAQQMKNTGKILALDISPDKLEKIHPEMSRLGISIVETRVHDLSRPLRTPTGSENMTGCFWMPPARALASFAATRTSNGGHRWIGWSTARSGRSVFWITYRSLSNLPVFWSMRSAAWNPKKMKPWWRRFCAIIRNFRLKKALRDCPRKSVL